MDAEEFLKFRTNTREGPFFCGDSVEKGRTITVDQVAHQDNVKRFSDKWITQRRIGNTVETYPHFTTVLGSQLSAFVGLKVEKAQVSQNKTAANLQRLEAAVTQEETTDQPIEVEQPEQDEEEAELPDEFEEFEDDDYNAEKYFDDGDGDGEIDEDGEPDYS